MDAVNTGGLMSVLVRSVQGYMSRFVGLGRRSKDK